MQAYNFLTNIKSTNYISTNFICTECNREFLFNYIPIIPIRSIEYKCKVCVLYNLLEIIPENKKENFFI